MAGARVGQFVALELAPNVTGVFGTEIVVAAAVGALDNDSLRFHRKLRKFFLPVVPIVIIAGIHPNFNLSVKSCIDVARRIQAGRGYGRQRHVILNGGERRGKFPLHRPSRGSTLLVRHATGDLIRRRSLHVVTTDASEDQWGVGNVSYRRSTGDEGRGGWSDVYSYGAIFVR